MSVPPKSEMPDALREALVLSEEMCEAARGGDWARVGQLAGRRTVLVRELFSQPPATRASFEGSIDLERLRAMDERLVVIAVLERERSEERLRRRARSAMRGSAPQS